MAYNIMWCLAKKRIWEVLLFQAFYREVKNSKLRATCGIKRAKKWHTLLKGE